MSMPQQGPPDPYAQGPVSGGPQSPYDPQAAVPPYQPTPPPPTTYGPPGPAGPGGAAPAARPQALVLGGVGAGVIALMFLVQAIIQFLHVEVDYGAAHMFGSGIYGVFVLLMAVGAGAAAVLAFTGTDFGRVFAAAVGGAAIWDAAGSWLGLIAPLLSGSGIEVDELPWVITIASILGGFAGIGVVIVMSTPALSTYFAEKRGKPAAGSAPMGPSPSGPGMPPPGAGQPQQGSPYGAQPQQGQQYGGQPPAGQVYGGQPQQGSPYGEQPQQGQVYGGQPPGAPPSADPGAPPPFGPQY